MDVINIIDHQLDVISSLDKNGDNFRYPTSYSLEYRIDNVELDIENIYEYLKNSEYDNFSKITICDATEAIFRGIVEKLRKIKDIEVLDVAHMSNKTIEIQGETHNLQYYYTETTAKNVNKWNAIEKLIEKLNRKKEEVVTIGDNVNDKEMLENAGLGIAMGNSAPYIKEIADVVVSDNNNDGVAEAIIHHCLAKCGNL